MIRFRKVKDGRRIGNRNPKTEKQLEASRESGLKVMLTKNPMYNPKSLEKLRKSIPEALKKRMKNPNYQRVLFKPGNQFGKLRKNRKISEEQKIKLSIKMMGRKGHPGCRENLIRYIILNGHPMENLMIREKAAAARRLKLPKDILDKVIKDFNSEKSIMQIAKEIKVDRSSLSKLLKRVGINFTKEERIRIYNKINPKIRTTQFKKGEMHGTPFKKGYKHTEEEKEIRRKKEVVNNAGKIIDMYNRGLAASKIAKQFNTTHNTILSFLRRNGMKIRPQREYILGENNPVKIYSKNKFQQEVKNEESDIPIVVPFNPSAIYN